MEQYKDELKQIEQRLFDICKEEYGSTIEAGELGRIWCELYSYIKTI